jgi:flagellar biosynthesis protein FlhF
MLSKPPGLGIESRVVEARRAKPETRNRSKKGTRLPTRFKGLHQQLLGHGVAADVARQLLEEVHAARPGRVRRKEGDLEEALKQVMIGKLKVLEPRASGGRSPSLMAFVGPTGVGKTTTIAKLAATSTLMAGKRVAMVTLDTYRIAAVEQLKVYGKIIGTPVTVAVNPEEVGRVLREARGLDLILIDTPGRCHRNAEQVWELKALLSQPWPLEVHLVLSATTREEEAVEMIRQFSLIPFHSLLFTKLDESGALGSLFNLAVRAAKPISYLTTGQRVPEDIEAATPERIVDIVLHGFWR